MRRPPVFVFLTALTSIVFAVAMIGCGGTVSGANHAPNNPPAAPAPSPVPSGGSGSGGSGSPGTGSSPSNAPFQQTLSEIVNSTDVGDYGLVSVSATGDVTIQVHGADKNSSYTWSFCALLAGCVDLSQTLVTDGSGNGQLTFHFPKTGSWAGYFSGKSAATVIDTQDAAHHAMTANLVSYNGVNGTAPCDPNVKPGCNLDPAQGTVTVANQVAHIVIRGGSPNTSYEVVLYGGGVTQGTINTDASGNVTADLPVLEGHGTTYEIRPLNSKAPVITGFAVK